MAAVNSISGGQMMLYVWDKEASTPAWRPVACAEGNQLTTNLNRTEAAARRTKCGIIPARRDIDGMTFELSANGVIVDTTSAGSEDDEKASHDFLLDLQEQQDVDGLPLDWKLETMASPGIVDRFGKGDIGTLVQTGNSGPDDLQEFTLTVVGVGKLQKTTTVE